MPTDNAPIPDFRIIKPTIGRRVWFWPAPADLDCAAQIAKHSVYDPSQPCDAGIVYVHNDTMVNLSVTDHAGVICARTSVRLLQEGEDPRPGEAYAQWMPYQVSAATKLDAAKVGAQVGSQQLASAFNAVQASSIISGDRYRSHIQELEASLVRAAASYIAEKPENAKSIAEGIKAFLDVLYPMPGPALVQTVGYTDGTTATGTAPLPGQSPAEYVEAAYLNAMKAAEAWQDATREYHARIKKM